jgi:phage protein D/phage baseplate assembly protein gpV
VVLAPRRPAAKHKGSSLSGDLMARLRSLSVDLSVHRPGTATLKFSDKGYKLFDKGTYAIGDAFEVLVPDERNKHQVVLKGELTGVGVEDVVTAGGRSSPVLTLTATEPSHRLTTSSVYKAYLEQSYADIIKDIASRHGLKPKVEATGGPLPYVLQNGSDYGMLADIVARLGMEFFIDGADLIVRKRKGDKGPTLKFADASLRRFSASFQAPGTPSKIDVFGWDPTQQKDVKGKSGSLASPSADQLGSSAPFVKDAYGKAQKTFGQPLAVGTTPVWDAKEADALADSIAADLVGAGLTVEGVGPSNPKVKPGINVAVDGVGKKLKGSYYVTSVSHAYEYGGDLLTTFRCDGHRSPEHPTTGQFRPGALDGWATNGLVLGVVTNIEDEQKLGRVKVRFPSLGANAESNWARVVAPGAGDKRGFDVRPEVNDEVVVAFERGDTRTPLVLGGVWSAKAKLPDDKAVASGKVEKRSYTSRAGHTLEFSDGPAGAAAGDAKRFVEIKLGDGKTTVHVGEDGIVIEAAKGMPITFKNDKASLALTGAGDIVMAANNLKIDMKADAKMKAKSVDIKGLTGMKLDGGPDLQAKGAQAKVEGAGMLTLKGGMVKIN